MSEEAQPEVGYNKRAYEWMLHEEFNKLKARLFNLAESSTATKEQSEAMKGLIKDFTNEAYYGSLDKMNHFLNFFKVLDEKEGGSVPPLEASSSKDILV